MLRTLFGIAKLSAIAATVWEATEDNVVRETAHFTVPEAQKGYRTGATARYERSREELGLSSSGSFCVLFSLCASQFDYPANCAGAYVI